MNLSAKAVFSPAVLCYSLLIELVLKGSSLHVWETEKGVDISLNKKTCSVALGFANNIDNIALYK